MGALGGSPGGLAQPLGLQNGKVDGLHHHLDGGSRDSLLEGVDGAWGGGRGGSTCGCVDRLLEAWAVRGAGVGGRLWVGGGMC